MSFKKIGLAASFALCAFPIGAHAGHAETVSWYDQYLPTISAMSIEELNAVNPDTKRSHRDNIRGRMFSVFNGDELPLSGDSFMQITSSSAGICTVATDVVENLRDNFRADTKKYVDEHWASGSWLIAVSRQAQTGCESLALALESFVEYRRVYDANPAKYDRLGYIPERIDVNDIVVTASYTQQQEAEWKKLRIAMREAE